MDKTSKQTIKIQFNFSIWFHFFENIEKKDARNTNHGEKTYIKYFGQRKFSTRKKTKIMRKKRKSAIVEAFEFEIAQSKIKKPTKSKVVSIEINAA